MDRGLQSRRRIGSVRERGDRRKASVFQRIDPLEEELFSAIELIDLLGEISTSQLSNLRNYRTKGNSTHPTSTSSTGSPSLY